MSKFEKVLEQFTYPVQGFEIVDWKELYAILDTRETLRYRWVAGECAYY